MHGRQGSRSSPYILQHAITLVLRSSSVTDPLSGVSNPASAVSKVDLPAPFPPIIPTMAPRGISALKCSIKHLSSKLFVIALISITLSPRRSPVGIKSSVVSCICSSSQCTNSSNLASRPLFFACLAFGLARTHSSSDAIVFCLAFSFLYAYFWR